MKRSRIRLLLFPFAGLISAAAGIFYAWRRSGPRYPQYCWIALGPEVATRLLVRFDGRTLAIDRNGDGKFDGKSEQLPLLKDCPFDGTKWRINHVTGEAVIPGMDGRTSYSFILSVSGRTEQPWTVLNFEVTIRGPRPLLAVLCRGDGGRVGGCAFGAYRRTSDGATGQRRYLVPTPDPVKFRLGERPSTCGSSSPRSVPEGQAWQQYVSWTIPRR